MQSEQSSFFPDTDIIWVTTDSPLETSSNDRELMTVSEAAEEFGVTPRALRFYESKGLLTPMREGGARLYRRRDRAQIALILKAKKFGFSLLEIRDMVKAQDGYPAGQSLRLSREKCRAQIKLLERQLEEVQEAIAELRRMHTMLSAPFADRSSLQG